MSQTSNQEKFRILVALTYLYHKRAAHINYVVCCDRTCNIDMCDVERGNTLKISWRQVRDCHTFACSKLGVLVGISFERNDGIWKPHICTSSPICMNVESLASKYAPIMYKSSFMILCAACTTTQWSFFSTSFHTCTLK